MGSSIRRRGVKIREESREHESEKDRKTHGQGFPTVGDNQTDCAFYTGGEIKERNDSSQSPHSNQERFKSGTNLVNSRFDQVAISPARIVQTETISGSPRADTIY